MTDLVSIIIPNKDGGQFLEASINSCLSQTYSNIEIILVDNGSTDSSLDIYEKYSELVKVVKCEKRGAPAARNFGVSICNGNYVVFLDSDDVLLPSMVEELAFSYKKLGRGVVPFSAFENRSEVLAEEEYKRANRLTFSKYRKSVCVEDWPEWLLSNHILISCSLYPKSALIEVGGFDEDLPFGQETDLNRRVALLGYTFSFTGTVGFLYRHHDSIGRISARRTKIPKIGDYLTVLGKLEKSYEARLQESAVRAKIAKNYFYSYILLRDFEPSSNCIQLWESVCRLDSEFTFIDSYFDKMILRGFGQNSYHKYYRFHVFLRSGLKSIAKKFGVVL